MSAYDYTDYYGDVSEDLKVKTKKEIDTKAALIRKMLSSPRHNYDEAVAQHRYWADRDPLFYTHLATWYAKNGSVRDHQEIFCAVLLASHLQTMQDAGFVLLQNLRTYQVDKIIKLSKSKLGRTSRPLKRAVKFWIQRRENIPAWLEECALRDRHHLKGIYASLHIKPCQMAQEVLFDETFAESSRFGALRKLSKTTDPSEAAKIIRNAQLPYTTAIGAVKKPNKEVWAAIIESMTGQQVINNLKAFQRRGLNSNPELATLINEKMKNAKEMNRASEVKKIIAAKAMDAKGDQLNDIMESLRHGLLKNGPITDKTAIFIDKSGSMDVAIKIGKLLATTCTLAMDEAPTVIAFDDLAHNINIEKSDTAGAINKKFELIRADGYTSIGVPFEYLREHKIFVDQIILISDGEQTKSYEPKESSLKYLRSINPDTHLVYIEILDNAVSRGQYSASVKTKGEFDDIFAKNMTYLPFSGDYYAIQTLVNALSSTSRNTIVEEVMACTVPSLNDLKHLEAGFDEDNNEIK